MDSNKFVQDKGFLFDKFNNGATLIIMNYGFHNNIIINDLLGTLENLFDIHASAHVYCGLEDTKSNT